jgi:hypothetical protein
VECGASSAGGVGRDVNENKCGQSQLVCKQWIR